LKHPVVDWRPVYVRDAQVEDATRIAAVARASWHAAYDDLLDPATVDATVDQWYDPASLREELQAADRDDVVFLVAERDSTVVGFANAGPARTPSDPAESFFSRLYVHPRHWGIGVGSALTEASARQLLACGYVTVWLEVFEENEVGRGFYESVGFDRVDAVEETFGETTLPVLHLRARLSTVIDAVTA
jgi:ribosomal protein S18 acetylase RimI-like enzyme